MSAVPSNSQASTVSSLPQGAKNYIVFDIFNSLSWVILQGAPILLYFKKLDASATVLAIVAALCPVLSIFSIPAANFVERYGYKKFMLYGWTGRTLFIFLMAVVAFLPESFCVTTRIALMLFVLFLYNTLRGISMCAMFPWITGLIPETMRGRFISLDNAMINLMLVVVSAGSALYLKYFNEYHHFAGLFFFSFVMGMVSLHFLKKVPDVKSESTSSSREPVPWKEILSFPPFKKLLRYSFCVHVVVGAGSVFYVPFFKDMFGLADSALLMFGVIYGIVSAVLLLLSGKTLDKAGSRPFLVLSNSFLALHFLGWALVAAKIVPLNWLVIVFQQMLAGFGIAFFQMANLRLAMGTVPAMGRSHFFAIFNTVNSLTLGLVPIVIGVGMDTLRGWTLPMGAWLWNVFTVFYLLMVSMMLVALWCLRYVKEERVMTTEELVRELFMEGPRRTLSRILGLARF